MRPNNPNGKHQRAEQMLTDRERVKIHELYRTHLLDVDLIAERFGMDEEAVKAVLAKAPPQHVPMWQVRWDDAYGERHTRRFKTFQAAQCFSAALRNVEWKRVERV